MATATNSSVQASRTEIHLVDRVQQASGVLSALKGPSDQPRLSVYDPSFASLIGPSPTHSLLLSTAETTQSPLFHEACVYIPCREELYVTSNLLPSKLPSKPPAVYISRLKLHRASSSSAPSPHKNRIHCVEWIKMRPPLGIDMPNGGVNYLDNSLIFCAQGSHQRGSGGIYHMSRDGFAWPLVTNFHGRDFNSVNDVVVASDGAIWFTDPCYGFEQGFRQPPQLPCQVYRFDPSSGDCRVVADGLGRPNGICFSPDEKVCYVTDTDHIHGDGSTDATRSSHIYAFDVDIISGAPFLLNKRVFAFAANGFPDGIKCDVYGNVYAGCGDGVEVWNPAGSLIGVIEIPGGVANFCFGRDGEMFICAEQKLWRVQLAHDTKGVLLGI